MELVNLTIRRFTNNVILIVLSELQALREEFGSRERLLARQAIERSFTPFYQRIGKAASLFAVEHRKNVKLALTRRGLGFIRYSSSLDEYIKTFSHNYFHSINSLPMRWPPAEVLILCGVIGAIADCCVRFERSDFVEVCCENLERDLVSCLENLTDAEGWQFLYDAAEEFSKEYDSQYLENETYAAEDLQD